jgi:hypothetical protein
VKAAQYVRRVMASMLTTELTVDRHLNPGENWMFGGLERPKDDKRIAEIEAELRRWIKRLSR